jgi:LmbE family N-acetylglucosaminyl deacetylase
MDIGKAVAAVLFCAACAAAAEPPRTILAIGAHAGDMEISAGAVLAAHQARGWRVVLLHLTLGEAGNPKLSAAAYGAQKRREAEAAARALGAEALFGPYRDGELPDNEEVRRYVAGVIRRVRPDYVFTHWKRSMHRDHARASAIVSDALLLAGLASVQTGLPPHSGVRVHYTENWEDKEAFQPFLYIDVTASLERWKEAARKYQLFAGGVSPFPYLEYYEALARVRGAESGKKYAVTFDVEPYAKKRVLDALP